MKKLYFATRIGNLGYCKNGWKYEFDCYDAMELLYVYYRFPKNLEFIKNLEDFKKF